MTTEHALFVPDLDRLLHAPGEGLVPSRRGTAPDASTNQLDAVAGEGFIPSRPTPASGDAYDRLYLGTEFCRWRLPTATELARALDLAAARGAALTLVTPFLDEAGLAQATELARALPADGAAEVVANDVGLLEALRGAGWGGVIVAGRLLTKQRRGPGVQDPRGASPEALAALRGSALDSGPFVSRLGEEYGVRRFEIDDLAQGADVPSPPDGVRLSLYRPWALVTATRNCPWVFDGRGWDRERGCARPCRGRRLNLEPEGWSGASLVLGGCAQFLRVDAGGRPIPPGVDRVVWQPEVPA